MNKTAVMKDPFYQSILFLIEQNITTCDRIATAAGAPVNDSQIRSILNKVRKTAEGGSPKIPNGSVREKILAELHTILLDCFAEISVEGPDQTPSPLPVRDWLLCLETVEESIQRRSTGPGSCGYLEFIAAFIPEGTDLSTAGFTSVRESSGPAKDKR